MRSVLLFLFLISTLFAGTKESFDTLAKRLQKEAVDIAFNFELYWSVREKTEKKKGTLVLAEKNRFDLTLGNSRWVSDGKTFWQYDQSKKQAIVRSVSKVDLSMNPSQMFDRFLGRSFKVVKINGSEILRWEGNDKEYRQIDVKLSSDRKRIESLKFVDLENNESRYRFTKMTFLKSVPSNRFSFVIPKGTEVMDER